MTSTSYKTKVLEFGNHASIEIPAKHLAKIGGNKRAPLKITVNNYTYQSTATAMNGVCMVVFPMRDRNAAGVKAGDEITVTLELDDGYREVQIPDELLAALAGHHISDIFRDCTYSKRKEHARLVTEAKAKETKQRRIQKIIDALQTSK